MNYTEQIKDALIKQPKMYGDEIANAMLYLNNKQFTINFFNNSSEAYRSLLEVIDWMDSISDSNVRYWAQHTFVAYNVEQFFIREMNKQHKMLWEIARQSRLQEVLPAFESYNAMITANQILTAMKYQTTTTTKVTP